MAVTRLSDVIVPDVFLTYMVQDTMEKTAIFRSGAVVQDDMLGSKLAGGGETFQVPFWNDLADAAPNLATDNPSDVAVPGKIAASKMRAIRQYRTYGWSDADLVRELAGSDPMTRIVSRIGDWWARSFQASMISTLNGVFADNTANDSGDMTYDVSGEAAEADYMISPDAIIEAAQTMGDASDQLRIIIMHSRVYATLAKLNLIDFIPSSDGKVKFPTYLGYYVIKDDGVHKEVDGEDINYSTYLLGPGVIGWAESPPAVPVETFRYPDQGNGAGVEVLWTRRQYLMHPYGFDWTDASVSSTFPSDAELATAANWNRVYPERKQIPIARLITKNG